MVRGSSCISEKVRYDRRLEHYVADIAYSGESLKTEKAPTYPQQQYFLMGFPKGVTPFGRRRQIRLLDNFIFLVKLLYCRAIALTGHAVSQAPHLMHTAVLMV